MRAAIGSLLTVVGVLAMAPAQAAPQYRGDGYGAGETVRCKSPDFRYQRCALDARGGDVQLVRRMSKAECVEGRNWGTDRNGVWVDRGCDAEFQVVRRGGGWGGGSSGSTVRCKSEDFRQRTCAMDTRGGVQLVRRISRTECVEGRNWGSNRDGVWVSQGCEAEFQSRRGGGRPGGSWNDDRYGSQYGNGGTVRCKSGDFRYRHCDADTRGGVQMLRQVSQAQCVQGQTWGYDGNGVWVDRGCEAEFRLGR